MFSTMVEYRDRLHHALKKRSVSVQDLADHLGVSYQGVKKVLDGKSAALNAVNHAVAARYLRIRSDWLAIGEEPMCPREALPERLWPFPSIDELKVRMLNHDDLVRLDAALLWAASTVGVDVSASKMQRTPPRAESLDADVKK